MNVSPRSALAVRVLTSGSFAYYAPRMTTYIVASAYEDNAHFVVYDSGTVRHLGGDEAHYLIDEVKMKLLRERDKGALADLYRDSATYLRPRWWSPEFDYSPYTPRPVPK